MAGRDPLIRIEHLHKVYRTGSTSVPALADVSFAVARGEFLGIMGPSGSGKTTLLNILGCLDTPTSGEYFLDGELVSAMDDEALSLLRNGRIGFVFQSFNLIQTIDALENVELPLIYKGVDVKVRRETASRLLERVGLGDRPHHLPSQLSSGQQQRVAIARSLACSPHLILADEPTGNLDSATGKEIMAILDEINRQGSTIVVITHDQSTSTHAHRIMYIQDGRIAS